MKKILILVLIVSCLSATAFFILRSSGSPAIRERLSSFEEKIALFEFKKISTISNALPAPLRVFEGQKGTLTVEGTIALTNAERAKVGAVALFENSRLAEAARAKLDDLFRRQYFEHKSPTGEGPSDLAESAGYDYILVGENLALGDFKDDAALISAWMASPGHRKNILKPEYREIGVAVGKGSYEGDMVWIAVQEFGVPRSACPEANANLRSLVDSQIALAKTIKTELDRQKAELDSIPPTDNSYNARAEEYNKQVNAYNNLLAKIKSDTEGYNATVRESNACIESFTKSTE